METATPRIIPAEHDPAELARLGDEIAELAAHLDAATARLLDLIREFDARAGWGNGFASCAAWLSWRVGFGTVAARANAPERLLPAGRCKIDTRRRSRLAGTAFAPSRPDVTSAARRARRGRGRSRRTSCATISLG
jgi:hypothetical protein